MLAMSRRRSSYAPTVEPNVIPFIDVLLVLLIIFMVTAPRPTTDLRVDLPSRHAAGPAMIEPTVIYTAESADGASFSVGGRTIGLRDLPEATLSHIIAANPALAPGEALFEARVFVRADMVVAYHNVVDAVDALKTHDFARVSIVAPAADAS